MVKSVVGFEDEDLVTIRKHWGQSVVFTDTSYPARVERAGLFRSGELWLTWYPDWAQELTAEELLPGEISAALFNVGCYTVRSAQWACEYQGESMIPASQEKVEFIRKYFADNSDAIMGPFYSWPWRYEQRVTHKISARHNSNPDGSFIYVCDAPSDSWSLFIGAIYTAKENRFMPDEYASLFVHSVYSGSSFSSDTWYKLDPTGKISTVKSGW